MTNELLWLVLMIVTFGGIMLAYRYFGRTGLYIWTAIAVIIANMQVLKTIKLFGFITAEGNIIYGTTFLATDILSEKYCKKTSFKAVRLGFFVLIVTMALMQLTLQFIPDVSDTMHPALLQIFGFFPRIVLASVTAYLISQHLDVYLFHKISGWTKGKHLWLRNNAATMISQLVDNVVFTFIAFVGLFGLFGWQQLFGWPIVWSIFWTSYAMKWVVAVCDTPFVYWAKKIRPSE